MVFKNGCMAGNRCSYLSMPTLISSLLSPLSPLHLSPPPPRLDIKVVVLGVLRVTFCSVSVVYWRVLYRAPFFAKAIGYANVGSTISQKDANVSAV